MFSVLSLRYIRTGRPSSVFAGAVSVPPGNRLAVPEYQVIGGQGFQLVERPVEDAGDVRDQVFG